MYVYVSYACCVVKWGRVKCVWDRVAILDRVAKEHFLDDILVNA